MPPFLAGAEQARLSVCSVEMFAGKTSSGLGLINNIWVDIKLGS